jgi:hypothetical protein
VISSILIEALARRAKELTTGMVARTKRHPDIADYRAAFEDELSRFDNAGVSTTVPEDVRPKRASLLPSTQPSLGRGLGQRTGGTAESDSAEAKRILLLLANVDGEVVASVCGQKALSFIIEMQIRRANGGVMCVTGKQVFYLRDLRDQLVEKGYV